MKIAGLEDNSSEEEQRMGELEGAGFKGKLFARGEEVRNVNSGAGSVPPLQAPVECEPEPPSGAP